MTRAGRSSKVLRVVAVASFALSFASTANVPEAFAAEPGDVQAPRMIRSDDAVQAPRGSVTSQARRGEETPEAPRTQDGPEAPRR